MTFVRQFICLLFTSLFTVSPIWARANIEDNLLIERKGRRKFAVDEEESLMLRSWPSLGEHLQR